MALNSTLAQKFYAGLWGKKIQHQPTQTTVLTTYSILSNDNVQWATIIAYSTIEQAIQNKVINSMLLAHLLQNNFFSNLANDYIEYFTDPAPIDRNAFNNWHSKECNTIIDVLKRFNAQIATYGIAQKIVNMTFKHLSCFSDAQTKPDHFKYCHMPIDRKILFWIKDQQISKSIIPPKSIIPSWSTLKDTTYTTLQDDIRKHLSSKTATLKTPPTVLEAEFDIWPEAKNNMKAKKNNQPYTWTY